MHSALLIDEVFEAILDQCSDWHPEEYRRTLAQLARTCKAWQDPSLSRLWRRLESTEPLLALQDSMCSVKATPQYRHAYEARIRHLCINEPLAATLGDITLPSLQSVSLLRGGCFTPAAIIAASTLREIQVDLGPIMRTEAADSRCKSLATTFMHLKTSSTCLEKLRIRGWMSPLLSDPLSSLRSLRSLVLSTGNSLGAATLASFVSFPQLQSLTVHASHIAAEEFVAALPRNASLTSLRTLRIRASRPLICAILELIPACTLRSLHIESEELDQGPHAWKPTFDLLISRATDTLTDLTIDQILEAEELDNLDSSSIHTSRFTLHTLRPLRLLTALQSFVLDPMILPDFADSDIDQLASWWPHLKKLDLGALSGCAENDVEHPTPKITLAALHSLAKRCRSLHTLILPLNLTTTVQGIPSGSEIEKIPSQTALHTLMLGGLPPSDADTAPYIRQILTVFPALEEIECTSIGKSLHVDLLTSPKDGADTNPVAMDGFANGQ